MVQIWSMLASRDAGLAAYSLQQLATPPSTTAWVTYARCHDDIGWAIDDDCAAAVGVSGYGHRKFLSDFYSGDFPGSWARGLVFQENPVTHDRRISGSLASLAGLEAGDPLALDRIRLVHAVVMGFGGVPVIWIGRRARPAQRPRLAVGPRARRRQPVGAPPARCRGRSAEDTHGVRPALRDLIEARKALPHLHAAVAAEVLDPQDPGVLLVARRHPLGSMLAAYNVTDTDRVLPYQVLRDLGLDPGHVVDRITGRPASRLRRGVPPAAVPGPLVDPRLNRTPPQSVFPRRPRSSGARGLRRTP